MAAEDMVAFAGRKPGFPLHPASVCWPDPLGSLKKIPVLQKQVKQRETQLLWWLQLKSQQRNLCGNPEMLPQQTQK